MEDIRKPGAWLEADLSPSESADVIKIAEITGAARDQKTIDLDAFIESLAPYTNSFMHLMYLTAKNRFQLTATDENGVITAQGKPFDIVTYTVDFLLQDVLPIEQITTQVEYEQEALLAIVGKRVKAVDFPLDKLNSKIWRLLEKDMGGQIAIAAEKTNSKQPINIIYSINFDALGDGIQITRKLEVFDRRVYIAIAALFNAGNLYMSPPQIYNAMGYDGRPGTSDLRKISESITKMAAAHIFIDNSAEANVYKYEKFCYDASLLPMERAKVSINGQIVEAIHIFREPPLMSFAKGRKQITTFERRLLTTPLNKTDQNMEIEDYLIERIAHAKSGKLSAKIKFSTIYEQAHVKGKQRQRAPEKVAKILEHYVQCNWIAGFKIESDGVRISW